MSGCNVPVDKRILCLHIYTRIFMPTPRVRVFLYIYVHIIYYLTACLYMFSLNLSFSALGQYTGLLREKYVIIHVTGNNPYGYCSNQHH